MSSNIVHQRDGELTISSEIIAERTQNEHRAVLQLIRTHQADFEAFGLVAFEMRARSTGQHGGGDVRYAVLNEHQATLLMTFMKNTTIVKAFKVELVKQFYAMRQALAATSAPRELSRLELIELAKESELARIEAERQAIAEGARADLAQKLLSAVEQQDGLVVREWISKYFRPRQERRIWDLFYSQRLIKDGRGQGGTDKHGKPKSSRDHQQVLTDGFSFFIRTEKEKDYAGDGKKRYDTRVRPGRAELELVQYCERHGIVPLPEVSQALFEIRENGTMLALDAAA
ncbi:hypothetical protein Leucomu_05895 [Leucobacter muris]|uniref:Phage regulatory protein n=1 Tax=Leucobacter muris TaxID=1935379 RepID=A0ABX5QEQ3_9MICO|nr:Rha family transcriptional regulator [Leucobacter muris]QAB17516.1 hypothetical protein Leucomu_05895 [Leucobacter muris]